MFERAYNIFRLILHLVEIKIPTDNNEKSPTTIIGYYHHRSHNYRTAIKLFGVQ